MTVRKAAEGRSEMPKQVVAQVSVVVNPEIVTAQPTPQLEPQWDEPELDPMKRHSIADDPDGSKNALLLAVAVSRHQAKAAEVDSP